MCHTRPTNILPHTLFKWRMRGDKIAGDGLPVSPSMRRRFVLLPVRCIFSSDGRGRGGGRLKPLQPFLSLLHIKVQESPPVFMLFHFGPCTFNFVYGPDFCYISFDLVRLGPSIEINSMLIFYFGPFNFWIEFKKINLFGTTVSILSFD